MNAFNEERSGFEQLWLLGGGHFKYFSFSNEHGHYIPNGVKDDHTDQELVYALVTLNTAYVFYMGGFKKGKGNSVQWQPIQIAPKDRDILLKNHEGIFQGQWDEETKTFDPLFMEYHGCGCCLGEDPQPTQWMELPLIVESGANE